MFTLLAEQAPNLAKAAGAAAEAVKEAPVEGRVATLAIFVGILGVVAAGAMTAPLIISWAIGRPTRHGVTKESPYECGSPILQPTRSQFDVRFFMLAMIFILFDIETVLMLPYLTQYNTFGIPGLICFAVFFIGLIESLAYAWKKGALDWK